MKRKQYNTNNPAFRYLMVATLLALFLPRGWTDQLDHVVALVLAPLSGRTRAVSLAVTEHLRKPSRAEGRDYEYLDLLEAYELERARGANLAEQLARQVQRNAELAGLRQLQWFERAVFLQADDVGSDSVSRHQILTLNRGRQDGLAEQQIALGSFPGSDDQEYDHQMCVVGRICGTGPWTSKLQLVSDPEFRLAVTIVPASQRKERWQAKGVLKGRVGKLPEVTMVRGDQPVQPGDIVRARADAQYLPVALMLGTVSSCERDDKTPVMLQITVEPAIKLNQLHSVVIISEAQE